MSVHSIHIPNDTLEVLTHYRNMGDSACCALMCMCQALDCVLISVTISSGILICWKVLGVCGKIRVYTGDSGLYSLCQGTGIAPTLLLVIVQAGIPRLCCTIRCNQEGTFRELGRALEAAFHCESLCHLYLKATPAAGLPECDLKRAPFWRLGEHI